ncbi:hypothetical protein NDU88_001980 [Pleurodeles waltl]|uniref:Uncharacterized protein n=1 Tax=Pleurodeles waltl TaxID=8319 RepID=A0AAV7UW99_PLEWA|nr:hypothetical protein NDU88_001980 [Pleurodeles waltl]
MWKGSLEAPPYSEVPPGVLLRAAAAGTGLSRSSEESWARPRSRGGPWSGAGGGLGRKTGLSQAAPYGPSAVGLRAWGSLWAPQQLDFAAGTRRLET